MQSTEIRQRFLDFFKKRGHTIIPSASLVPEDDPSVLFTTAGMQPLVPFLLGQKHPSGQRIANSQKCVRTQDIEEIGDKTHDTFFEMLGNWSLGTQGDGYWKQEAIEWSYEFLTSSDEGLGLDPDRLYITCYEGDDQVDKDSESAKIWQSLGIPEHRIFFLGKEDNWWSPGDNGPCGPDTEMFYDVTKEGLGDMSFKEFKDADDRQKVVEVWNDVFMQYEKKGGEVVGELNQKNVDTGAGLERLAMVMQGTDNVFATDLFRPIIEKIDELSVMDQENTKARRVVADHIRTSCFIIADGVTPNNVGRGYVLRRIIRRAVRFADELEMPEGKLSGIAPVVIEKYKKVYPELQNNAELIEQVISDEESNFRNVLERGRREFEKIEGNISGEQAFDLYQSHGLPIEVTEELAKEKNLEVNKEKFEQKMEEHKKASAAGSGKKFAGGLADTDDMTVRLHTATHLLNQALRDLLGDHVQQQGSNITTERLRFDFTHDEALTEEQIQELERIVNEKIQAGLEVSCREESVDEAKKSGAIYLPHAKYPNEVTVYEMSHPENHVDNEKGGVIYSREICMGPHVDNTGELGTFKITKESSSSKGVRRIRAVLE